MNYILLCITIIFATANNIFLHRYSDKEETCNVFAFNASVSFLWFILLIIIGRGVERLSLYTVLFGVVYGAITALFLFFKMLALGNGPVSITSLIVCCSLIVPTLCGSFIWKEHITISQVIGLVLLFVSLYFVLNLKFNTKISGLYIVYAIATFLFAGISGVAMKIYAKMGEEAKLNDMMVIASLVAFILFFIIYFCSRKLRVRKENILFSVEKRQKVIFRSLKYILLCGITSCVYQRVNLFLSGELPSVVLFPIFNGMVIFLSCVAGVCFFEEKLTKKQIWGILVGSISIMLVGKVICF